MITTIAFDLDDTLYDEVDYCRSGFGAVAEFVAKSYEGLGGEQIFAVLWKQFTGGNRTRMFNRALEELGVGYDDKLIGGLIKVYRSHIPEITLPTETGDVLRQLSDRYTLAILTDGFLPAQQLKVQALGIEKYFKCIIYTEQMGRDCWKPSPAGFEKIMETLNTKPENIVYIADNEKKDFITPNKLGFFTIQLIRPARIHTSASAEPNAAAQYVIHTISRLPELINKL